MFKVDYCLCVVFFLKHPHVCFSFSPYELEFGLPVGPSVTHGKAAYRGHLFFSHSRILVRLCMGFLGLLI